MTPNQFDALSTLLGLRDGPAQKAAQLVLVFGLRAADAARLSGCSRTSALNAVARCRRGLELARVAAGAE